MQPAASSVPIVFNVGQATAVRGAFHFAGYDGSLSTPPLVSGDEVCFVMGQDDLLALKDVRVLEQILQRVLQRKVWVLASVGDRTVPFGQTARRSCRSDGRLRIFAARPFRDAQGWVAGRTHKLVLLVRA
jgi:hypothetical protein